MVKKMKNIEIVNAINGLSEFVNKDKDVPIELSFAITANLDELTDAIKPFEKEREKIVRKIEEARQNEDTETANAELEKLDEEFNRLMNIEVDAHISTVGHSVIKEIERYTKISTKDLMCLRFMIKESEEDEENTAN